MEQGIQERTKWNLWKASDHIKYFSRSDFLFSPFSNTLTNILKERAVKTITFTMLVKSIIIQAFALITWRPATLLERHSSTGVFLWILKITASAVVWNVLIVSFSNLLSLSRAFFPPSEISIFWKF